MFLVKQNRALYPIGTRLFGANAIVLKPNFVPDLVQQARGFGRGLRNWVCLTHLKLPIGRKIMHDLLILKSYTLFEMYLRQRDALFSVLEN